MMLEAPLEAPLEAHLVSPEAPPPDQRSRLMMLEAPLEARPRVASRRHPATSGVGCKCSSAFSQRVSHGRPLDTSVQRQARTELGPEKPAGGGGEMRHQTLEEQQWTGALYKYLGVRRILVGTRSFGPRVAQTCRRMV